MAGLSAYITAFLLGLAGSLHCAGMCGPIYWAASGFYESPRSFIKPHILHHAGRWVSYAAIGAIMGALGQVASFLWFQNQIMVFCGALLILVGVGYWFRIPLLTKAGSYVSKWMGVRLQASGFGALVLGVINGLIPCGLVYGAAIGAAATLSLYSGILFMICFGLGTAPLLSLIAFARWMPVLKKLRFPGYFKQIPLIVLGIWLMFKGLELGIPYLSPDHTSHNATENCCRKHQHN